MAVKSPTYAVAAKSGTFQPQRIEYDARGKSTVVPLADWQPSLRAAEDVLRLRGWVPFRERAREGK